MRKFARLGTMAVVFTFVVLLTSISISQEPAGPPPPDAGGAQGADGGRRDPAQFRQRMMERVKEQMNVSEDEWKVIEPLLATAGEKRMQVMRYDSGGRGMMGGRGMGRRGGDDNANQNTPNAERRDRRGGNPPPEVQSLREALENPNTSGKDLQAKMTALREARAKAQAELKTAREELRKVLKTRQEAQLVLMGVLD